MLPTWELNNNFNQTTTPWARFCRPVPARRNITYFYHPPLFFPWRLAQRNRIFTVGEVNTLFVRKNQLYLFNNRCKCYTLFFFVLCENNVYSLLQYDARHEVKKGSLFHLPLTHSSFLLCSLPLHLRGPTPPPNIKTTLPLWRTIIQLNIQFKSHFGTEWKYRNPPLGKMLPFTKCREWRDGVKGKQKRRLWMYSLVGLLKIFVLYTHHIRPIPKTFL